MKKIRILLIGIVLIGIVTGVVLNMDSKPILIGYSSGTTGRLSEVGVDGRNAFLLKIKEVNNSGGINGKKVTTLVLDDQNDPDMVPEVHEEFDKAGVKFIVGHIISALDMAVLEEAKDPTKLILSASMSSSKMDGLDDSFIRLTSSYKNQVSHINIYMTENDDLKSLSVIYDLRNKTYTEGFLEELELIFPGEINSYSINEDADVSDIIVNKIEENPTDGILMLTPASVTALACQILDTHHIVSNRYSVSWSMTNDLFVNGGRSVEGLKIVYVTPAEGFNNYYEEFRQSFIDEYAYEPSSICFNTYETVSVLIEALEATDSENIEEVKNYIIEQDFVGLLDTIKFDETGDREQVFVMFEVQDGEFVVIR